MMKHYLPFLLGLSLLANSPGAAADTGAQPLPKELANSHVRVVRTGGFSPFKRIEYSVIARTTAPLANFRKSLVNYNEELASISLVSLSEYRSFLEKIREHGAFTLTDGPGGGNDPRLPVYEVDLKIGDQELAFSFQPTKGLERHQAVVDEAMAFVLAHTHSLPFRNVFFDTGSFGYLDVVSVPIARVYLDGRDTGLRTPLESYEVPAGRHSLRLVSESGEIDRQYDFRVEAGMTTLMKLDLR